MRLALRRWRYADHFLLVTLLMLLAYGLAMVYSATYPSTDSSALAFSSFFVKQAAFIVAGIVLMVLIASVDYRLLHASAYFIYAVSLLLLAAVFLAGHGQAEWGSQRWIDLKLFPLQPSELAKPALVLALARYYADHESTASSLRHLGGSLLIALPSFALVYAQPDLGTSATFLFIWFFMALVGGARVLYLLATALLGLASLPLIWGLLKDYMRDRITIFLHPETDPWGQGYNIIQAQISIGSGGMYGRGFLAGTQSQGHFLRIQHSDFIFSVLAEEMGFVGAVVLFLLFLFLLTRILRAARLSRDHFGRLAAAGIALTILFSVVVNVAANVRLMPVTGIPLTFISYGGSSMLTNLIGLGIVQSILMHRRRFLRP